MAISHWPECESLITAFSLAGGAPRGLSTPRGAGDKKIDAMLMFGETRSHSFDCVEARVCFLYRIESEVPFGLGFIKSVYWFNCVLLFVCCFLVPPLSVFGSLFIPFFGFLAFVIDVITFYYFWTSWNLLCLLIVDFSVFIVSVLKLNL